MHAHGPQLAHDISDEDEEDAGLDQTNVVVPSVPIPYVTGVESLPGKPGVLDLADSDEEEEEEEFEEEGERIDQELERILGLSTSLREGDHSMTPPPGFFCEGSHSMDFLGDATTASAEREPVVESEESIEDVPDVDDLALYFNLSGPAVR